jgi:hypothetical protein
LDLVELAGKAVKIVSLLLPNLPANRRYKVIFLRRPSDEILASQSKMLQRRNESTDNLPTLQELDGHRDAILRHLSTCSHVQFLTVDYPELIANPDQACAQIVDFLGPERLTTPTAMADAIRPDLYRNRSKAISPA